MCTTLNYTYIPVHSTSGARFFYILYRAIYLFVRLRQSDDFFPIKSCGVGLPASRGYRLSLPKLAITTYSHSYFGTYRRSRILHSNFISS